MRSRDWYRCWTQKLIDYAHSRDYSSEVENTCGGKWAEEERWEEIRMIFFSHKNTDINALLHLMFLHFCGLVRGTSNNTYLIFVKLK